MAKGQRKWTEADRARALAILDTNGGNLSRTAREVGCSLTTLRNWRDGVAIPPPEVATEQRDTLAAMWERIATKAGGLTEAVLDASEAKPDPRELRAYATTAAIATDKRALLTGGATDRIEHVGFDWARAIGLTAPGSMGDRPASGDGEGAVLRETLGEDHPRRRNGSNGSS